MIEQTSTARTNELVLNGLYLKSIKFYEDILKQYMQLHGNSPNTELTTECIRRITRLQQSVEVVVKKIDSINLEITSLAASTKKLQARQVQLLQNLLSMNKEISQRALDTKAFLLHELNTMNSSRIALNGYGVQSGQQKRIINNTF